MSIYAQALPRGSRPAAPVVAVALPWGYLCDEYFPFDLVYLHPNESVAGYEQVNRVTAAAEVVRQRAAVPAHQS